MTEQTLGRTLAALEAAPYYGHSDLYRWLRKHHAVLASTLATHRSSLQVLAGQLQEAGMLGARGQAISYDALRKIWQRVCRDVARDKAAEQAAGVARTPPTAPSPTSDARLPAPAAGIDSDIQPTPAPASQPTERSSSDQPENEVLARLREKLRTRNY